MSLVIGIFVGGASRRMGGRPKGLLAAPGATHTLVERSLALSKALSSRVVLVGAHEAYRSLGVLQLEDAVAASGPLGGLVSLLTEAAGAPALALACDLPFWTSDLLARLRDHAPGAALVAPRQDGRWNPLFARYDSARILPVAREQLSSGERSLQPLFLPEWSRALPLEPDEEPLLRDWDTPEDASPV